MNLQKSLESVIQINVEKLIAAASSSDGLIYVGCDEVYFKEHAFYLAKSLQKTNPNWFLHVHLFNPSNETIETLNGMNQVSYSSETTNSTYIRNLVKSFKNSKDEQKIEAVLNTIKNHDRDKYCSIIRKLVRFSIKFVLLTPKKSLEKYFQKTYYSIARFCILEEINNRLPKNNLPIIALDADALFVNKINLDTLATESDLAIKTRNHAKQRFLAGAIYYAANPNRKKLLATISMVAQEKIKNQELMWGIDQLILNDIIPKFDYTELQNTFGDLNFHQDSCIWLAKGNTKDDAKYLEYKNSLC